MKKLLSILLAVMMLMTCFVALAEDPTEDAIAPAATETEETTEDVSVPAATDTEETTEGETATEPVDNPDSADGEHGPITGEEYFKNGELIPEEDWDMLCAYSPVIWRVFYEDGYYQDEVKEFDHVWELESDTATCTEGGIKTYVCVNCGASRTETSKALGHLWSSESGNREWGRIIKEATCYETGLAEDYCERCGETGTRTRVIEKTEHDFQPVWDYLPHCYNEEKDLEQYQTLLSLGVEEPTYTETSENGVEVTFILGMYHDECTICGEILEDGEDEEIFVFVTIEDYQKMFELTAEEYDGHMWDAWVRERPYATCTEAGKLVRWCKWCGVEEHMEDPAHNHSTDKYTYVNYANLVLVENHIVDCFHRYNIYVCSECGEEIHGYLDPVSRELTEYEGNEDNELFAVESHIYPDEIQNAMATGVIDNDTYQAWLKNKKLAKYIVENTDPTCEEDGSITFKCIYADEVDGHDDEDNVTFVVTALGHDWTPWVVEHEVGEDGNEFNHWVRTCRVCGKTQDFNGNYSPETCPDGAHKPAAEPVSVEEATCTEDGLATYICTICGEKIEEILPATGHSFGEGVATAATCTEAGFTTYTCANCGETKVEAGDPATGHNYDSLVIVEATCADGGKDGKILHTCANCGDLAIEIIPAPEHVIVEDEAVAPEIGKPGKTAGSHCDVCGEVITAQEEIPALQEIAINTEDFADGTVTVENAPEGTKLYARVTWRFLDPNGEGILIVSTGFVDPEDGTVEVVEPSVNGTLDFCTIIITDTARPSTKAPSAVNRMATATID